MITLPMTMMMAVITTIIIIITVMMIIIIMAIKGLLEWQSGTEHM